MKVNSLIICLLILGHFKLNCQSETAINHFNEAVSFVKAKDYKAAIEEYNNSIDIDPKYTKALYNRGNAYMQLKEYTLAAKDYKRTIKLQDSHAKAHYYLAYCQMQLDDNANALISFTRALKHDNSLIKAHYYRGYIQMIDKNYERAIQDFNGTLALDHSNFKAAYNMALCHFATDQLIDAANAFTLSIEIDPNYLAAYEKRALVFKKLGKNKLALNDYESLISKSESADAYYNRALLHESMENTDLALSDYNNALRIDPKHLSSAKKKANLSLNAERLFIGSNGL